MKTPCKWRADDGEEIHRICRRALSIALAVACDASETCRSYGETVLKKRCGVGRHASGFRQPITKHSQRINSDGFLGITKVSRAKVRNFIQRTMKFAPILRRVLSRSQLSANLFPQNVEVISSSLNNPRSKQLRSSGMEFSAWVYGMPKEMFSKKPRQNFSKRV